VSFPKAWPSLFNTDSASESRPHSEAP
jgi:hypothetical protein